MTNIDKLWGKLAERRLSKTAFAGGLGMDRTTLRRKSDRGLDGFSCQEMINIGLFLKLTVAEMNEVFLADYPIV